MRSGCAECDGDEDRGELAIRERNSWEGGPHWLSNQVVIVARRLQRTYIVDGHACADVDES